MNVSQHMTSKDTVNWTGGMGRRLQFVAKDGDCIDVWFADLPAFEKVVDAVTQMHTDWVFSQMTPDEDDHPPIIFERDGEPISAAEAYESFAADQESIDRANTCRWDASE